MDSKDKELLNLLQEKLPLDPRPFMVLGRKLGITEEEVIERIKELKRNGYIRRIGGSFNSGKLGYVSTLCAIQVHEERIQEVGRIINSYPGVTHNYIRNHTFNMWFTLIAPSPEKIEQILEEIRSRTAIDQMMNLPSVKVFKIKANFDVMGV